MGRHPVLITSAFTTNGSATDEHAAAGAVLPQPDRAGWMMALHQKIERDRRREVLLNRLYKSGKVNRF